MSNPVQPMSFRAGVAARLAGIPVETLRVWERRYQVSGLAQPKGKQRLYSRDDIARLALLKQLVDLGQPIRAIAKLDHASLTDMQSALMSLSGATTGSAPSRTVRAGLIGPGLASLARQDQALWEPEIEIVLVLGELSEPIPSPIISPIDTLLIEVPSLMEESRARIQEMASTIRAGRTIVLYRYAPSSLVRQLRAGGLSVLRSPIDPHDIQQLLAPTPLRAAAPAAESSPLVDSADSVSEPESLTGISAPRFSDDRLARLSQIRSQIYCECPSQLSDLLIGIRAFERYSANCANRSPEDAQLHRHLEQSACKAREILERALDHLVKVEKIEI